MFAFMSGRMEHKQWMSPDIGSVKHEKKVSLCNNQ